MIDWYAYTLQIPRCDQERPIHYWLTDVEKYVPDYMRPEAGWAAKRSGWTAGKNIGNHTFVWIRRDGLMLVEHTGKGCDMMRRERLLMQLINDTANTCTRIDLAVDMHNPGMAVKPSEFADDRGLKRTSSGGTQASTTGETVYIGSRKSERYCRVYQYAEPHPRADFMRVEYVLKKEYAKRTATEILLHGVEPVERGMAAFYEWQHSLYDWSQHENAPAVEVPAAHVTRENDKTLRWLHGTVTSAVMRLVREGDLDIVEFTDHLKHAVYSDIPF